MNRPGTRPALIAGISLSVALLSAVVAFGRFPDKAQAIGILTTSALIYGVSVAWLESGYVLLRSGDAAHATGALFALLTIVRVGVFGIAAIFGLLVTSFGLPALEFAAIAAGLSCGNAVISALRSGKVLTVAALYLMGAVAAAAACAMLNVGQASTVVLLYAVFTGMPVFVFAAAASRGGAVNLVRHLFSKTKPFIVDLPVTAVVENGDRVLLSAFGGPSALVAYNGVKVAFGLQREFNRFLKQVTFHRLFDEATGAAKTSFTRTYLVAIGSAHALALTTCLIVYWFLERAAPPALYVEIALCISTAYSLIATHSIAGARALTRSSSAFWRANIIAFGFTAAAAALLLPFSDSIGALQAVYVVSACYVLFYAVKTFLLFLHLKP